MRREASAGPAGQTSAAGPSNTAVKTMFRTGACPLMKLLLKGIASERLSTPAADFGRKAFPLLYRTGRPAQGAARVVREGGEGASGVVFFQGRPLRGQSRQRPIRTMKYRAKI